MLGEARQNARAALDWYDHAVCGIDASILAAKGDGIHECHRSSELHARRAGADQNERHQPRSFLLIRRIGYSVSVFDSPFFPTALMFMVMGFYSILMGLIAELQVRTYHEAQAKPTYNIREIVRGQEDSETE